MKNDSVNIGVWLERGFDLYRENLDVLVPASAMAFVLGVCTFGALSGPMLAGLLAGNLAWAVVRTVRARTRRRPVARPVVIGA